MKTIFRPPIKVDQRISTKIENKVVGERSGFWFWFWYWFLKISKSLNFQATTKYNIPLERSWIDYFCGNRFGNVNWNYYHQKLWIWYISKKFMLFFFRSRYNSIINRISFPSPRKMSFLVSSLFLRFQVFSYSFSLLKPFKGYKNPEFQFIINNSKGYFQNPLKINVSHQKLIV